jgi:tetratricopeptide (TPR) repeat protein
MRGKTKVKAVIPSPVPSPASQDAIAAALAQDWKEAIRVNSAILKEDKSQIDALNRLGYAYIKTAQFILAKKTLQKVIALDPYNQIAEKNLKKIGAIRQKDVSSAQGTAAMSPMAFLEEPGVTKLVECIHLAPMNVLSSISAGQEVELKTRNHTVEIRYAGKTYLAALPDDLAFKIIKLTAAGNTYQAIIKGVGKNTLTVLLRERSRGKKFAHQPSFISTTSYVPFARGVAPQEGPDMTPTGEGEEGASGVHE